MAERTMSPEARARIAAAQKKRWAAVRKNQKAGGKTFTAKKTSSGRRRGRPRKVAGGNPYLNLTVAGLIEVKRQFEEVWGMLQQAMSR